MPLNCTIFFENLFAMLYQWLLVWLVICHLYGAVNQRFTGIITRNNQKKNKLFMLHINCHRTLAFSWSNYFVFQLARYSRHIGSRGGAPNTEYELWPAERALPLRDHQHHHHHPGQPGYAAWLHRASWPQHHTGTEPTNHIPLTASRGATKPGERCTRQYPRVQ